MRFRLKSRFHLGETLFGTFIFSTDPAMTEIAGGSGFDFVIIDREHSVLSWTDIAGHIRAAAAVGIAALVRVRGLNADEVTHALDAGAEGVVLPHFGVDREASRTACRAMRFAPEGDRGTCTGTRSANFSLDKFSDVVAAANSEALAIVQIEDPIALDGIDELLASMPVDAVMPGLADLSTALGHPGDFAHPDVLAAADRLFAAVRNAKLPLGLYVANSSQIEQWRGATAQFYVYAIDYKIVAEGYRAARTALGATASARANAA